MFKDNSRKEYNIIFYMRDREKINCIKKMVASTNIFKKEIYG